MKADTNTTVLSASADTHTDNYTDTTQPGDTGRTDNDTYTLADDIRDITSAIIDLFRWIASFSLTDFLCRILGHGFDPEGSRLPEWKFDEAAPAESFRILENEHVEPEGEEGYAVYDGVVYANAKVTNKEPWDEVRLTPAEVVAMYQYSPTLRNLVLAKKIKYHLGNGKSDEQIAMLVGYSIDYVKHYRLAFEKAAEKQT